MPLAFKGAVFKKLSQIADLSSLSREERSKYDYALKKYRDTVNVWKTNWEEGHEEGRKKGLEQGRKKGLEQGRIDERNKIICNMLAKGMSLEDIASITGIPTNEILPHTK